MLKTTITKELAAMYPSLKGREGETVDQQVIVDAKADGPVEETVVSDVDTATSTAGMTNAQIAAQKKAKAPSRSAKK